MQPVALCAKPTKGTEATRRQRAIRKRDAYFANVELSRAEGRAAKARERELKRQAQSAEAAKHREVSQLLNRWRRASPENSNSLNAVPGVGGMSMQRDPLDRWRAGNSDELHRASCGERV